jgi:hypothetical protein
MNDWQNILLNSHELSKIGLQLSEYGLLKNNPN